MTQLPLNDRIAQVRLMLDKVEAFIRDLRNAPARPGVEVTGWEADDLYVFEDGRKCHVANVLNATRYAKWESIPRAWNGAHVEARPVDFDRALARTIGTQEDLHTWLSGQLQDLYAEAEADYEQACAL